MHAPSIAGEWSIHADIISVQISETPETHGCARSRSVREAQNYATTGINLIGRHTRKHGYILTLR